MMHALITLLISVCLYPFNLHTEVAVSTAIFYVGREHAQAEYRSIVTYYGGSRINAPWWCGFEPRAWNKKSILDWLLPTIIATAVTYGL